MITEDYVNFEVAKLLKEKGFDEPCRAVYEEKVLRTNTLCDYYNRELSSYVCAPTLQMAIKWLREEKGIAIVPFLSSILDNEKFLWHIKIVVAKTNKTYHQGWVFEQFENAVEAALKYTLENLI